MYLVKVFRSHKAFFNIRTILNTFCMKQLNLNSIRELKPKVLDSEEQKKVKGGSTIIVDIIGP
ncbi:hypothetical protein CRP01_31135 [Flavilitoribacter nigricans DSM 23189 = NBRC 102662]|uniref:Uncharacterized protein n=1 Tax=Flavilitoribacter nigricans (strain ATCC 23147 / DSM 23189 / NBRC 102662 / NCIMB 1420 / SS-2) TaxID=1122177 RepID=A0A2D0N2L5_FLAN2|nr:hypothetical protein CRP01_31135 [Flavilitoribacter nigricans DSM 23189 = NBRC 102662]